MEKYEFDLEEVAIELERTKGLLCVYRDFLDGECPTGALKGKEFTMAAQIFAARASMFSCVIDAAQDKILALCDKILALCDKLNTAIEEFEAEGASV